jgi:uncharacterized protein (TIGR02266 family)
MSMGTGAKPAPPPFPNQSLGTGAKPAAKPAAPPLPNQNLGVGAKPAAPLPNQNLGAGAKPAAAPPNQNLGTGPKPAAPPLANQSYVRASERYDLEVKVDLESDHNFYTGLTQNISAGGVFIATHMLRKIGDRITLNFTLPGSAATLSVETEVRWIRENTALMRADGGTGMGVRFINLSPEASAAITKFLQSRDSLYYDDEE